MVPVRWVLFGLADTVYDTVPFPDPLAVVAIQLSLATADHVHPVAEVTPNDPDPPADPKLCDCGLIP